MLRPSIRRTRNYDLMDYFDDLERSFFGGTDSAISFNTDVIDRGDHYELQAELPGFEKEDINIDINGSYLSISAEHKEEREENNKNFVRKERRCGSFHRSFNVNDVDTSQIDAEYKKGILHVKLPKVTQEVPSERRIEIK